MTSPPLLADVSDTARWVAYFRAIESARDDALFHDPFAGDLAGERGRRIADGLPHGPLSYTIAVRTRVFDEIILDAVGALGVRCVLNLAAGLDARPYRLPLPSALRWIEIDLPEIVAAKASALSGARAACAVERIALDLSTRPARQDLFAEVAANMASVGNVANAGSVGNMGNAADAPRVLVVTEGLLVYLEPADVASLAVDLRRSFPGGLWLLENLTPEALAMQRRAWGPALRAARAEHRFAPQDGLAFYAPYGWAPRQTRSLLDEAARLRRGAGSAAITPASTPPATARAYARRRAMFRSAVTYALMETTEPVEFAPGAITTTP